MHPPRNRRFPKHGATKSRSNVHPPRTGPSSTTWAPCSHAAATRSTMAVDAGRSMPRSRSLRRPRPNRPEPKPVGRCTAPSTSENRSPPLRHDRTLPSPVPGYPAAVAGAEVERHLGTGGTSSAPDAGGSARRTPPHEASKPARMATPHRGSTDRDRTREAPRRSPDVAGGLGEGPVEPTLPVRVSPRGPVPGRCPSDSAGTPGRRCWSPGRASGW